MSCHKFNIKVAELYGVGEAIILENLSFWQLKNEANDNNFFDEKHWVYNSIKAFEKLFPYWSKGQINRILKHLEDEGVIHVGNYNRSSYDRTKWYSVNQNIHLLITGNGYVETKKPIPDKNTDSKPDENKQRDLDIFKTFKDAYQGSKRGNDTEFENFKKKTKDWKQVLPDLTALLKCQVAQREVMAQAGVFVPSWKNLQTWINNRCWEEEQAKPETAQPRKSTFKLFDQ